MKVSEIEYKRCDINEAIERAEKIVKRINVAESVDEVLALREQYIDGEKELVTYSNLAFLRWSINTKDKFYKNEKEYYEQNTPLMQNVSIAYNKAILNSKYLEELKQRLPAPCFALMEVQLKVMDERLIPYMQQESKVLNEYQQFMSSFTVCFDGKKIPFTLLKKYMSDKDRETRRKAFDALGAVFEQNTEILDGVFDKLVKIRTEMARSIGYKNYVEYGYNAMHRICYNSEMIAKFRKNILETVVPAVSRMRTSRAKKLGIDEMKLFDYSVFFSEGDAEPILDADGMFAAGKEMYHEMSIETGKFIDTMLENESFDVFSREGKWGGGYCTELPKYSQLFILANFNGTSDDVDVLTHEAGHAFADYITEKNNVDYEVNVGGMETAETHSMSMEYFAWKYMDKFFGEREKDYKYKHLLDNLSFLTYGTIVDYFQHIVYENPEMTPAERNECWKKLEAEYRPFMNADGMRYFEKGTRWQYQMHIYELPFYYIDYVLAQSNALQFLIKSQENYDESLKHYFMFTGKGGSEYFTDLVKQAGLKSPFEDGALKESVEKAEEILNKLER